MATEQDEGAKSLRFFCCNNTRCVVIVVNIIGIVVGIASLLILHLASDSLAKDIFARSIDDDELKDRMNSSNNHRQEFLFWYLLVFVRLYLVSGVHRNTKLGL